MSHICPCSTWKAGVGGLQKRGQPGLHCETLLPLERPLNPNPSVIHITHPGIFSAISSEASEMTQWVKVPATELADP